MLKRFLRLVRLDLARHQALVESATPLPFDVQETVTAGLTGLYGAAVKPTFIVTPALLGGMVTLPASEGEMGGAGTPTA